MEISFAQLQTRIAELAANDYKVDVIKLAESFGIKVYISEEIGEGQSLLDYNEDNGTYSILLKPTNSFTKQRYEVAYLLSKYLTLKHESAPKEDIKAETIEGNKEVVALTEEILIPEKLLFKFISKRDKDTDLSTDRELLELVATYFEVSESFAAVRLSKLGYLTTLSI